MLTPDDFVIWWTDSNESQGLDVSPVTDLGHHCFYEFSREWPTYLQSEIRSRVGRGGHGRLWVAEECDVFPNLSKDLDFSTFDDCGGIVLLKTDIHHLSGMPGRVTDRHLNIIPH